MSSIFNVLSYRYQLIISESIDAYLLGRSIKNKESLLNIIVEKISERERGLSRSEIEDVLSKNLEFLISERMKLKVDDERVSAQKIKEKYNQYFEKFYQIVYRKVTFIDEYGDESWDELEKEIKKLLSKIQSKEGNISEMLYSELSGMLRDEFSVFYNQKKENHIDIEDFNQLDGIGFETLIMNKLQKKGYSVQGTPKTGDQGADIIAIKDGTKYIIQAKRYSGSVGNGSVQEVIGALSYYGGDEGLVITNSTFTNSAKALAQKSNIQLIDGHSLLHFLN